MPRFDEYEASERFKEQAEKSRVTYRKRVDRQTVSSESQHIADSLEDLLEFMDQKFPEDRSNREMLSGIIDDLMILAQEYGVYLS